MFFEHISKDSPTPAEFLSAFRFKSEKKTDRKKLIIIGAGDCGEKIYRELHDNASLRYKVVGFLDDDKKKIGKTIHGVPVLGKVRRINRFANEVSADEGLIAIPSASAEQMRKIVYYCNDSGIEFKTIPSYGELINGRVTVNAIREVAYRDLIGREPIRLDENKIGKWRIRLCCGGHDDSPVSRDGRESRRWA